MSGKKRTPLEKAERRVMKAERKLERARYALDDLRALALRSVPRLPDEYLVRDEDGER